MFYIALRGFRKGRLLRQVLTKVANEIEGEFPGSHVFISLQPESRRKGLFSLTLVLRNFRKEFVITKMGARISTLMRETKNDLIRKAYQTKHKKFHEKHGHLKELNKNFTPKE